MTPQAIDSAEPEERHNSSVNAAEVAKFTAMADAWWDPAGDFRPLHRLNPVRVAFIRDQILAHYFPNGEREAGPGCLSGLSVLDIGCGGGLVCEPLTRLGAQVMGVDATQRNISIAQAHAQQVGLSIDYQAKTSEQVIDEGRQFDVVLALEVIEHVNHPQDFVRHWQQLIKPEGLVIASTINKSLPGFVLGVIGAEYVMRWLPIGTHDWRKFVSPARMQRWLRAADLRTKTLKGLSYQLIDDSFRLSDDTSVNYIFSATNATAKPPTAPEFALDELN